MSKCFSITLHSIDKWSSSLFLNIKLSFCNRLKSALVNFNGAYKPQFMKITLHPWLNSALLLEFSMFFVLVMMDPLLMRANHLQQHPNSILIANNPKVWWVMNLVGSGKRQIKIQIIILRCYYIWSYSSAEGSLWRHVLFDTRILKC